mmetsp:Transcript_10200/g.12923  ORF Transcript_10200/g.12923 Transcript_10200/m.12923 type:complete len:504 (-) Transcript_10200:156-1667(-)
MDKAWYIAASLQMSSASISFLASTALVVVILRTTIQYYSLKQEDSQESNKKKKKSNSHRGKRDVSDKARTLQNSAYKRIIFCISLSDMIQSISSLMGPFAVNFLSPWSLGQKGFCTFDGLLLVVGSTGVLFYSPLLTMYYYCKLHLNMEEEEIYHKVEKKVHWFTVIFIVCLNTYALAVDAINSATNGTGCTYAATPTACRVIPGLDCDSNEKPALALNIITAIIIPFLSLFLIVSLLSFLLWKISFRERILPPSSLESIEEKKEKRSSETIDTPTSSDDHANVSPANKNNSSQQSVPAVQFTRKKPVAHKAYRKEMMLQLVLYSLVFIMVYIVYSITILQIFLNRQPHIAQYYWIQTCGPLQGLFNILIFNRPDARVLKYRYPELSWMRAFWLVFINGGDSSLITDESLGITSLGEIKPDSNALPDAHVSGNEYDDCYESHDVHISSKERFSHGLETGEDMNCVNVSSDLSFSQPSFQTDASYQFRAYGGVKIPNMSDDSSC